MASLLDRTRPLFTSLLLAVLLLTTAAFFMKEHSPKGAPPEDAVVLPIEVIGADGYTETVQVEVAGAGADRLYLQLHAASYHPGTDKYEEGAAKAGVRINGGPWLEITDETFTCEYPESAYGCIDGVWHTVRGTLPIEGVQEGVNTITFRFNGTDGIGAGYRVLALDVRSGGVSVVSGTEFVEEDPTTWAPPEGYDNPADIEAGEDLWHNAALLESSLDDADMINAACADCHATDGRDLKYFNYSNQSITARSRFHGLSAEEGRQIAAYIRDIQLRLEDGTPYAAPGRPWNPPYQPGPTLAAPGTLAEGMHPDSAAAQYWASGAGLQWVLDEDIETLPYLFPDPNEVPGPDGERTQHQIPERYDYTQHLNMREIPLAVQFPDWNNWLPDVHPMDMPQANFLASESFLNYQNEVLPELEQWDQTRSLDVLDDVDRAQKWMASGLRDLRNAVPDDIAEADMRILSVNQWALVKSWEMHHGHYLADKIDDLYDGGRSGAKEGADWSYAEARSWIGRSRIVFDLAPHIGTTMGQTYGSLKKDRAFSHLWYHLQTIINPGADPKSSKQRPVDWRYQRNFINGMATKAYHVDAGVRGLVSYMKQNEMHRQAMGDPYGWGPLQVHPVNLVRMSIYQSDMLMPMDPALRAEILSSLVGGWISHINTYFTIDDFPRGTGAGDWEPSSYQPTLGGMSVFFGGGRTRNHANNHYRSIVHLANLGVRADVLQDIAVLGSELWPNPAGPDWSELVPEAPPEADYAVHLVAPSVDAEFTVPATVTLEAEITGGDEENVNRVQFFAEKKRPGARPTKRKELGERREPPFEYVWRNAPPGKYALTARLVTERGVDTTSAPVPITVVAPREPPNPMPPVTVHELKLARGWNMISSWVRPEEAALDSVLAEVLSRVVLVKNERGETFIPTYNINTIGSWEALDAYMIYMKSSAVLAFEGKPLDPTTVIPLERGWNLVPYLHPAPMPVETAFASIAADLVVAKDYAGRTYIPKYDVNDIERLQPGQGYKVFVKRPTKLTYPPRRVASSGGAGSGGGAVLYGPMSTAHSEAATRGTSVPERPARKGAPASAVIVVEAPSLRDGQHITAWGETSGKVGEGTVEDGRAVVTIYGDVGATTGVVEGATGDETVTLKLMTGAEEGGQPLALSSVKNALNDRVLGETLHYAQDALVVATVESVPATFALEQNYPNPFTKSTTISYSLPAPAEVQIEVYDVLGRRVATLVDDRKQAGWHEEEFSAVQLPSGVYFYRLRTDDKTLSKEMVIVR